MQKKIQQFLVFLSIFVFILLPSFVPTLLLAQDGGLVPCGTEKSPITTVQNESGSGTHQEGGDILNPCGFEHFFVLVNTIVRFLLFYLAVPIAAILFAYAGIKLVFSGGNASKMSEAKSMLINVAIGLALAAGAWLIVHTLLQILGYTGQSFGI